MKTGFVAALWSRLAVFGGRGMSFNICRGTLGSLAMFTAIRSAASHVNGVTHPRISMSCRILPNSAGSTRDQWGARERPMSVLTDVLRIAILLVGFGLSAAWSIFLAFQVFRVGQFALEFLLE